MDSINEIWMAVLNYMKPQVSETAYRMWLQDLILKNLDGKCAVVECNNQMKYNIVSEQYKEPLEAAFEEVIGFHVTVEITTRDNTPKEEVKPKDTHLLPTEQPGDIHTFDTFIEGYSNKFAYRAAMAVAKDPGGVSSQTNYNPLFIYGPSGLGKTHLMFAIINEVKRKNPKCNIIYITGEQFTNELIDALAAKKNEENVAFRDKYRNCDMLLVDDIQFIAGKYSIQEEFFHTFDALYKMKKQIVLTSDRSPKDIQHLEDRLVTRFEMGLITDIQPPDPELRTAIFKIKTKEAGIELSNEVLTFLAENIRSNIRKIEGAIKKLWAQSFITGEKITLDMAKEVLKDYFKPDRRRELTPENILNYVAKRYSIVRDDILSKKRTSELVYARHIAIYLTCELTDLSLKKVGKQFNRDHATIISAKNSVVTRMKNDAAFANDINESICELTGEEPQ